MAATHPARLRIVHALSREKQSARVSSDVRQGRVTEELMRELIPEPSAVEVFACGPGVTKFDREAAREKGIEPQPRFLEAVMTHLTSVGVPKERIHRESYG